MTVLRIVLLPEPPGDHPRAPRASAWRQRSDEELFWLMTVARDSAEPELVGHVLAVLTIDHAVAFLPVAVLRAHPGMAVFQRNGGVTDQYRNDLSSRAVQEMTRIAAELVGRHLPYLETLAHVFRAGEPTGGVSRVPAGHPLLEGDFGQQLAFFAPDPPLIEVRGRREEFTR